MSLFTKQQAVFRFILGTGRGERKHYLPQLGTYTKCESEGFKRMWIRFYFYKSFTSLDLFQAFVVLF